MKLYMRDKDDVPLPEGVVSTIPVLYETAVKLYSELIEIENGLNALRHGGDIATTTEEAPISQIGSLDHLMTVLNMSQDRSVEIKSQLNILL